MEIFLGDHGLSCDLNQYHEMISVTDRLLSERKQSELSSMSELRFRK